jgi:hypothetical protein
VGQSLPLEVVRQLGSVVAPDSTNTYSWNFHVLMKEVISDSQKASRLFESHKILLRSLCCIPHGDSFQVSGNKKAGWTIGNSPTVHPASQVTSVPEDLLSLKLPSRGFDL